MRNAYCTNKDLSNIMLLQNIKSQTKVKGTAVIIGKHACLS